MNKRQAKKKRKIYDFRKKYDFLPLNKIKEYDRQYDAIFNSPQWKKESERQRRLLKF